MTISDTASTVELVFAFGGLIALAVNVWAWRDAHCDVETIRRERRNGLLRLAARANRGRERTRTVLQAILIFAAIEALATADPPEPYASSGARQLVILSLLVFQWGLAAGALGERRTRKQMLEYDRRATRHNARRDRRSTDRPSR